MRSEHAEMECDDYVEVLTGMSAQDWRNYHNRVAYHMAQHTCVGCGSYVRHPGSRWRGRHPNHVALPVCSDCNPSLHDRQPGRNPALMSRTLEENWYTQNQWDNWVAIYEKGER